MFLSVNPRCWVLFNERKFQGFVFNISFHLSSAILQTWKKTDDYFLTRRINERRSFIFIFTWFDVFRGGQDSPERFKTRG